MSKVKVHAFLLIPILFLPLQTIFADDSTLSATEVQSNMDYLWTLTAAALVFMMQAGFMCLESGLSRAKNSINVAIKNMADFVISVCLFWMFGFGFMFGDGIGITIGETQYNLIGSSLFFLDFGSSPTLHGVAVEWAMVFFIFQVVFAGTAATIDSGAVAGRTKFSTYLVMSAVVSCLVYPIFGHWAWGSLLNGDQSGWLESLGFLDFAGSTVVHSIGGWVALAGVTVIGPRIGKFDKDGKPRRIAPHNMTLAYLGGFILFFGWFGFNCGSTTAATPAIAPIAFTTVLSAAFGGVSATAIAWILAPSRKPDGETIVNGVLGGLVGITAGCNVVGATGACLIGVGSGIVVYLATNFVEKVLKKDDVVGAVAVHGFSGAWGTIATGLFMKSDLLDRPRFEQVGIQSLGVLVAFIWAYFTAYIILKIINKYFGGMRVSEEDEIIGLNVAEHGATSSVIDLANAMNDVTTNGNYGTIEELEVEIGTEIGDLSSGFNKMVAAVRLEQTRTKEVLQEIQKQKVLTEKEMNRFNHYMEQHVSGMEGKTAEMQSILNSTEDKAESMIGVVAKVENQTNLLVSLLEEINLSTEKAQSILNQAVNEANDSKTTINALDSAAKQIGDVIQSIDEITEQTKLLALNASIEASRAGGGAGGRFNVVANEVKSLASQSHQATEEITQKIGSIQGSTLDTVKTMGKITNVIEQINEVNNVINKVIAQQTSVAENIDDLVRETKSAAQIMINSIEDVKAGAIGVSKAVTDSYQEYKHVIAISSQKT